MENQDKDYKAFELIVKKVAKESNALVDQYGSSSISSNLGIRDAKGCLLYGYETGGNSGGSCWSGSKSYTATDVHADFDSLDDLLEIVVPDIRFLQYKKLKSLYKYDSYYKQEYYGNSTDYNIVYVKTDELYKKLKELNLELNLELGYKLLEEDNA